MSSRFIFPVGANAESVRFQIGAIGPESSGTPNVGDVLTWDGTQWVPTPGGGGAITGITVSLPLASSGGATPNLSLTPGVAVGEVITWDGSDWVYSVPSVPVTSVTASSPLSSSGGATPDISLDPGTAPGDVLGWDGSDWTSTTPAAPGITDLTGDVTATGPGSASASVVALQGNPVSASAPAAQDVLAWDGAQWAPTPPPGGLTGTVSTTNATPTTILSITPDLNSVTNLEARVTARKTSGPGAASYGLVATYLEDGGLSQVGGTTSLWSHESDPTLDVGFAISGGNLLLRVTGNTAVGPALIDPVAPPAPSGATFTVGTLGGEDYPDLATALADLTVANGDLLVLSAETFLVSATISVTKQVTIQGAGIGATILQTAATGADPVTVFNVSVSNVALRDLTIQQRRTINTGVENAVTISAGAGSSGHYLEAVRVETVELGVVVQSDDWQIANCELAYVGPAANDSYLVVVSRSDGQGILADTQISQGVSNGRVLYLHATGGANLLGGYLRVKDVTLLPGETMTYRLVECDAFSESATLLSLVVDGCSVNEKDAFVAFSVDKAGLLGFFDYIALLGNTISGTHGGAPIGTKGAFSLDGTAGPFAPGSTTFYAAGNVLGVTTYRGGYSTAMDTVSYPAASDQALMGRNASYTTPNEVITAIVTADWNWTASVTIQKVS